MRSSTSNSDSPYRFFVRIALFLLLLAATTQVFRLFDLGYPTINAPTREGDRIYLAWDNANYDHLEYMFDGGAVRHAADADILLLGNSRLMMGVRFDALMRALSGTNLKPHWLGFAQGEPHDLPERIVEQANLAPRLAIMNVDNNFFTPGTSLYTQSLDKLGKDKALETYAARAENNRFWRSWQRYFPIPQINRWDWKLEHKRLPLLYRSETYGDWLYSAPEIMIRESQSFGKPHESALPPDYDVQLEEARKFVTLLRERGTEIVFITVPNPNGGEHLARAIGNELGVEVVTLPWEGYTTFDTSHLRIESAEKFTRLMMEQVMETEAWNRALNPPTN